MSNYEFWDELGKIFSAVVAYQEKNIEFNKRFIVPWIRLGNVFDKQDKNDAAISAYQQAIDIDPSNAQNWFELGNIHFKMQNHSDAIHAFNKAIELDPGFGWSYNNLALTLVAQGQHEQAIPLYRKSIELLSETKDKAVAWNRLGNVHRKLNQYEQALDAFHQADQLDKDNAGFRDDMDEVAEGPTVVQSMPDGNGAPTTRLNFSPIELIIAQSRAEEAASHVAEDAGSAAAAMHDRQADPQPAVQVQTQAADNAASAPAVSEEQPTQAVEEAASAGEETVTVVVPDTVETFTETLPAADNTTETSEPVLASTEPDEIPSDGLNDRSDTGASFGETTEVVEAAGPETEALQAPEPVAKLDATGELQIEMDTKNAHVWNELGNVYFNTSAFDDAIVAYSKAIELDRWFAWPYSNLALAYVQKRRFVEAILLYQRSIELFTSDKDKAISWNRLGNVYRRLNDYENAIAAYQRADALDPDNATLSLQSRFSLLGNYAMDQKPSYAS
jgi:tetratricopeptide (TPR) repeat protein